MRMGLKGEPWFLILAIKISGASDLKINLAFEFLFKRICLLVILCVEVLQSGHIVILSNVFIINQTSLSVYNKIF